MARHHDPPNFQNQTRAADFSCRCREALENGRDPTISRPVPDNPAFPISSDGSQPPPLDDTPEALYARNHAAIAKVAALLPVNANEIDLAAQCIAARAQAEDLLRLLRQHAGDIALVMRLNAQYASMVRTSLSVLGRLMRVQALRHKREAIGGAADQDAWTQHVVERSMAQVVDPDPRPPEAASPERARSKSPERARSKSPKPAPVATQAKASPAYTDQTTGEHASENETDSQDPAFETWLRERPWNRGSTGPDDTALRILREAMAKPGLESPASGRVNLGSTANDWHGEREKASA